MKFSMHVHKRKAHAVSRIPRNRKVTITARKKLRQIVHRTLVKVAASVGEQLKRLRVTATLHKGKEEEVDRILANLNLNDMVLIAADSEEVLAQIAKDGAVKALAQIGLANDETMLEVVNHKAVLWARERAGELVGKKWDGFEWIDNPNAEWVITDEVREGIRRMVTKADKEGWSNDQLADELKDAYEFSEERSAMIARTETAFADVNGNLITYDESGVVEGKLWILGSEHDDGDPDECNDNADDGVIGLREAFSSGHQGPPAHPNCVCDVLPVLADQSGENE